MIASIFSVQVDCLPFFAPGVESLIGQVNNPFHPVALDWNVSADLGQMPSGRDAQFDLQSSTDHGTTWTSLLLGGLLVVSAGGLNYGRLSTFTGDVLAAGTWVRLVCVQAGSNNPGHGLQANLFGRES